MKHIWNQNRRPATLTRQDKAVIEVDYDVFITWYAQIQIRCHVTAH
jgi:hypothetical protein